MKSDDLLFNISHTLNTCSASVYIQSDNPDKIRLFAIEEARKELVLHIALLCGIIWLQKISRMNLNGSPM